jgi:hypothetical protein
MRQCAASVEDTIYILGSGAKTVHIRAAAASSESFGDRVAAFAGNDFARDRYHWHGRTILQQLGEYTRSGPDDFDSSEANVISAYLRYHLLALQDALAAGESQDDLSAKLADVLRIEARAQGYLADAFSAGHILSRKRVLVEGWQKRNRIEAHHFHRDRGVYVINARGDCWQTFGDGLLHWYQPTYRMVLKACQTSLKEVLLVFCVSAGLEVPDTLTEWLSTIAPGLSPAEVATKWMSGHDGAAYYKDVRLPSLMLLPMPVAASWRFRTGVVDEDGELRKHHYPQLKENGLHDPELDNIDVEFLYSKSAVPSWMVPEPLRSGSVAAAHALIRSNPDWTSVRWVQRRNAPPSYKGLLIHLGGQMTVGSDDTRLGGSVGIGYGFWDDLLLVKNVSVSASLLPSFHRPDERLVVLAGGGGLDLPGEGIIKVMRLDIGPALLQTEDATYLGSMLALGVDTRVFPLRFTNAGITLRARYQWFNLDQSVSGPAVELVWQ